MTDSKQGGASNQADKTGYTSASLIGRDRELRLLVTSLAAAPRVAVVEGEAGVGKSRLVREATSRGSPGRLLTGYAHPVRDPFPLGPVVDMIGDLVPKLSGMRLSPLAGVLAPFLPQAAASLPPIPPPLESKSAEQHRIFRALVEVLEQVAPAALVVEDLHWADETTLEFLGFLASRPRSDLSLVLTYRGEEAGDANGIRRLLGRLPPATTRLHLEPLDEAGVGGMIETILEADRVSEEFTRQVHRSTAGLPFAVEEVLRLLIERRDLVRREGRWTRRILEEIRLPIAVRDSVLERVERLSPEARAIIEAAAVLGVPEEGRALRAVAASSPAGYERGISRALSSGLLREGPPGRYALRHALATRAVEDSLIPPVRRRMHARAVDHLRHRADPPMSRLAHHSRAAGWNRAWARFAEAAADVAESLGDDAAASRMLQELLAEPRLPRSTRARLAAKLGRTALHGLTHAEAVEVLGRILDEEPLSAAARGEMRFSLGLLLAQAGRASDAVAEIERSVKELRSRPGLAAWALTNLAVPATLEGHLSEHMAWLDRAMRLAERQADPAIRMAVLADRAGVLLLVGDPAGWRALRDLPEAAASVEEQRHLVRSRLNLAQATFHIGYLDHARRFLDEGVEMSERLGYERQLGGLETTRLLFDWASGAWDSLEERAASLLEETAEVPPARVDAELVLGLLAQARGRFDEANECLEACAAMARRLGAVPILALAAGSRARASLARSRPDEALKHSMQAVEVIRRKAIWAWSGVLAPAAVEALLSTGRLREAEELTGAVDRGLRDRDAPAAGAGLEVCRAVMAEKAGRTEAALRRFAAATRIWERLSWPYEAARAREGWGRCALEQGRTSGASRLLAALEVFRTLGAEPDVSRARATLRSHGIVFAHRRGRRGYGSDLSPREREVARLVTEGRTNREIARLLFLSPKTVEHHVSAVLRKVGAASRRDLILAGAARTEGGAAER